MPTSQTRTLSSPKAFTLIELMVVIFVLALFAAVVTPNLVAQARAREERSFFSNLAALAQRGREVALSKRQPTILENDGGRFVLKLEPAVDQSGSGQVNLGLPNQNTDSQDTGSEQEIGSVTMPSGISTSTFQQGGQSVGQSDWKVQFYSDGSADPGGVEMTVSGATRSLDIDKDGIVKLQDGPLPDHSQDSWAVGTYEQRQQQTNPQTGG